MGMFYGPNVEKLVMLADYSKKSIEVEYLTFNLCITSSMFSLMSNKRRKNWSIISAKNNTQINRTCGR